MIGWILWVEVQDLNNEEAESQDPGLLVVTSKDQVKVGEQYKGHPEAQTQRSYQTDVAQYHLPLPSYLWLLILLEKHMWL